MLESSLGGLQAHGSGGEHCWKSYEDLWIPSLDHLHVHNWQIPLAVELQVSKSESS